MWFMCDDVFFEEGVIRVSVFSHGMAARCGDCCSGVGGSIIYEHERNSSGQLSKI